MAVIIVTGSKGQLGRALFDAALTRKRHRLIGVDLDELDIRQEQALEAFLRATPADYLINCAGYTAVDKAEEEPEEAFALNGQAVKNLARICSTYRTRLIHISTDYVFDGNSPLPYQEDNLANPLSVYGQSKLEGETGILYHSKDAMIIRTSWLYYHGGKNFVNTIIEKGTVKKSLSVVYDQAGSPTYALDLAGAILSIIESGRTFEEVTFWHYSNSGVCSWFDFARAITDILGMACTVEPTDTAALGQPAKRPPYSVMNCEKVSREFGITIPYWRDSLAAYLEKYQ